VLQPYADSRFSPYFTLGAGLFENRNRASLVGSTASHTSTAANAGLGARFYLTRNFLLRLDYRQYLALTSVQKNDRFDEELVGLSFFF
jgi:opacity protein-like surface antigen